MMMISRTEMQRFMLGAIKNFLTTHAMNVLFIQGSRQQEQARQPGDRPHAELFPAALHGYSLHLIDSRDTPVRKSIRKMNPR